MGNLGGQVSGPGWCKRWLPSPPPPLLLLAAAAAAAAPLPVPIAIVRAPLDQDCVVVVKTAATVREKKTGAAMAVVETAEARSGSQEVVAGSAVV